MFFCSSFCLYRTRVERVRARHAGPLRFGRPRRAAAGQALQEHPLDRRSLFERRPDLELEWRLEQRPAQLLVRVRDLGAGPEQDLIADIQVYPGHELVLARSIITFVISWSIIKYRGISMWGVNKKWLLIRSLAGTTALTIFFYTIHHIP